MLRFRAMDVCVMKFGGASMADASRFGEIARWIKKRRLSCPHIAVVVSAMASTTDQLLALAQSIHPQPPKREQDMLVSVGERVSMSLLAMALELEGIEAMSFTGSQAGILTTEDHCDAEIVEVYPHRVIEALRRGKVAIIAGFQGMSKNSKEVTTLGRGGSDISAVALAAALGARCVEFYKDVPGIGNCDPKVDAAAQIFSELAVDEAMSIAEQGAEVLHPACLALAQKEMLELQIRPYYDPECIGTRIDVRRSSRKNLGEAFSSRNTFF